MRRENINIVGNKLKRIAETIETEAQLMVALRLLKLAVKQYERGNATLVEWFKLGLISNRIIHFKPFPPTYHEHANNRGIVIYSINPDYLLTALWPSESAKEI